MRGRGHRINRRDDADSSRLPGNRLDARVRLREARTERVLERTVAGGVSVNETVMHIAQNELPFGGVGPSGMGHYHGRDGFLTFSKQKPVLYQARFSSLTLMRPPYRRVADLLLKFLTR